MKIDLDNTCIVLKFYDDSDVGKLCDIVIDYARRHPSDAEAGDLAARCREALRQMYPSFYEQP